VPTAIQGVTLGEREKPMLQTHVVLSQIGIVSGLVVFYGLLFDKLFSWTAAFLVATIDPDQLDGISTTALHIRPPNALSV
jgi:hypothetical protein